MSDDEDIEEVKRNDLASKIHDLLVTYARMYDVDAGSKLDIEHVVDMIFIMNEVLT